MKYVRWGIVGAGRIAGSFANDIKYAGHSVLKAVASRTPATAHSFAETHSIDQAFDTYEELLDSNDVDAIYIASPHSLHAAQAEMALTAGKSVLCEKPMTTSLDECRKLVACAQQSDAYLMEGMWTYFLPAINKAIHWVKQGRIGTLKHIKIDFGYPQLPYHPERREYAKELGGGCLLEMGIYLVAMAQLFLGREPIHCQAQPKFAPNGVEDDVAFLLDYGDVTATMGSSYRCKLQNWAYIIGETGYIAIPDFWRADSCRFYELDTLIDTFKDEREGFGFQYEIESVSRDILEGKKSSSVAPHSASLKFQQQLEYIRGHF